MTEDRVWVAVTIYCEAPGSCERWDDDGFVVQDTYVERVSRTLEDAQATADWCDGSPTRWWRSIRGRLTYTGVHRNHRAQSGKPHYHRVRAYDVDP